MHEIGLKRRQHGIARQCNGAGEIARYPTAASIYFSDQVVALRKNRSRALENVRSDGRGIGGNNGIQDRGGAEPSGAPVVDAATVPAAARDIVRDRRVDNGERFAAGGLVINTAATA